MVYEDIMNIFKLIQPNANRLVLIVFALFAFVVGFGVTGSSLGQGLIYSGVLNNKVTHLFGTKPREIRSDEWLVFTPMAIGQKNHQPPFPIINRNLGPDGQNMLIVGMAGAPVFHISMLGKPATWGFFFLELKQALAWYWWLPIFGSFLAMWGLIHYVFRVNFLLGIGLAGTIISSPYMVGWSFWPAYAIMFPSLAVLAFYKICNSEQRYEALIWAICLVIALTGFVLILYPAWQVPLAYLFGTVLLGVVVRDRIWSLLSKEKVLILLTSLAFSVIVLLVWWLDAKEAIASMTQTLYPGQRTEVRGGDTPLWFLVKGLVSPWLMFNDLLGTNQSESASFFYFFIPILALLAVATKNIERDIVLPMLIFAFVVVCLFYQYIGFSELASQYTFWGRTTGKRADLALGVAQYLMLAGIIGAYSREGGSTRQSLGSVAKFLMVIFSAFSSYYLFLKFPTEWSFHSSFVFVQVLALLLVVIGSGFLLWQRYKWFFSIVIAINIVVALTFNPVLIAPKNINSLPVLDIKSEPLPSELKSAGPILMLGSQVPAMMLFASGATMLNGIHYYPQGTIWRALDPDGDSSSAYNRYQHLMFFAQDFPSDIGHKILNPGLDVVQVFLNGRSFDFSKLPATHVIGGESDHELLRHNRSLKFIGYIGGMVLYRVADYWPRVDR